MDTRITYQNIIKRVLQEYAEFRSRGDDPVKSYIVFDDQHGRYLIVDRGWEPKKYWHTNPIHLELIDNKIWIQQDDTEDGIATDLVEAGVPKEDIVLGFRPPELRKHTGFGAVETP
jgi:hypothetical protein